MWESVVQALSAHHPRQQVGRLLQAVVERVQFLLHGQDALLQLPVGVIPVGAEVEHDHLHLVCVRHETQASRKKRYRFNFQFPAAAAVPLWHYKTMSCFLGSLAPGAGELKSLFRQKHQPNV